MAVNTGQHTKPYTLQHIFNQSFDPVYQTLVVQGVEFDPAGNGVVRRVTTPDLTLKFDYDASNNPIYIGKAS